MAVTIMKNCTGCGRCVAICQHKAISLTTEQLNGFGKKMAIIDKKYCALCFACLMACPHKAISD